MSIEKKKICKWPCQEPGQTGWVPELVSMMLLPCVHQPSSYNPDSLVNFVTQYLPERHVSDIHRQYSSLAAYVPSLINYFRVTWHTNETQMLTFSSKSTGWMNLITGPVKEWFYYSIMRIQRTLLISNWMDHSLLIYKICPRFFSCITHPHLASVSNHIIILHLQSIGDLILWGNLTII